MPSRWGLLAWANFGLVVSAMLKFIPIAASMRHGLALTPEQVAAGLADERAWALDLISDTPYLLLVWLSIAMWVRQKTGSARVLPWREPHQPTNG